MTFSLNQSSHVFCYMNRDKNHRFWATGIDNDNCMIKVFNCVYNDIDFIFNKIYYHISKRKAFYKD